MLSNNEAVTTKYNVCVCVSDCILALVIQHENLIFSTQLNIVTRGLSDCTIFFDIVS